MNKTRRKERGSVSIHTTYRTGAMRVKTKRTGLCTYIFKEVVLRHNEQGTHYNGGWQGVEAFIGKG